MPGIGIGISRLLRFLIIDQEPDLPDGYLMEEDSENWLIEEDSTNVLTEETILT